MREIIYLSRKLIILSIVAIIAVCGMTALTRAQDCKKPVTLQRLKINLKNKTFSTKEIVGTITDCGADFQLTPDVESELVAVGARPQVIEAARNNYRQEVAASAPKKPVNIPVNTPVNTNVSSRVNEGGSDLTKAYVTKERLLTVLRNKSMSNGAILDAVEKNGVDFETTSSVEKELVSSGASPPIITAVKNAYSGKRAPVEIPVNTSAGNTNSNRYQTLVENAVDTYNRDANANLPSGSTGRLQAIQMLTQAIELQPNSPTAYQQLGFMTLYGTQNGFNAAENNFKKAIELGGSAVFRVYHDHDGVFKDTCNGSLYISKDNVRFESDDNKHTFDVKDDDIKQIKTNSSFVKIFQLKSGSYKIVLKSGDNKNFNFAPLTASNDESKMVIRLIGK